MSKRRRHDFRTDVPFTTRVRRPRPQLPMPMRHSLENAPSDPGAGYSWLFVFLGCAALALFIAYPEILAWLIGLGVVFAVIAATE